MLFHFLKFICGLNTKLYIYFFNNMKIELYYFSDKIICYLFIYLFQLIGF
jgi:hypothetical protein